MLYPCTRYFRLSRSQGYLGDNFERFPAIMLQHCMLSSVNQGSNTSLSVVCYQMKTIKEYWISNIKNKYTEGHCYRKIAKKSACAYTTLCYKIRKSSSPKDSFIGACAYIVILTHPIESIRGAPYISNDKQGNRDLKLWKYVNIIIGNWVYSFYNMFSNLHLSD